MKCHEVRERLVEYIDGRLEERQLQSIEEHLQGCPDCRRELESMRELDAGLKQEVPAMWESIEPSAAFLNRLKSMELEPEKTSFLSFLDPLVALFRNNRAVTAAGLTALIAIVLALTVPGIISEDGSEPDMVAEAPSPTVTDEGSHTLTETATEDSAGPQGPRDSEESQSKGTGSGETAVPPATTDLNGTSFAWETEEAEPPVPAPTTVPSPTITYPTKVIPPAGEIIGESTGGENLTAEIALADPQVQQALDGETIICIEILQDVNLEGYVCSGSTISIATDETAPVAPFLYVCVESGSVTSVKILSSE
ncbi:MAG: zf-HC2 domain-containing protein [Dehalococcoidia bacterium]